MAFYLLSASKDLSKTVKTPTRPRNFNGLMGQKRMLNTDIQNLLLLNLKHFTMLLFVY